MVSACLGILPRAVIWFLNSWDYLFYLIILFTYETLEWVKQKTLFLSLITWFWFWFWLTSEAVARRCSRKKVFLEISQNSQENSCASVSFLIKLQALGLGDSGIGVFLWFCEISKNTFFTEHLRWLLLPFKFFWQTKAIRPWTNSKWQWEYRWRSSSFNYANKGTEKELNAGRES